MVNLTASLALLSFMACGGNNQGNTANNADEANKRVVNVPQFNADSAFYFVKAQVDFGPRAMNTAAHDACGDYLAAKLEQYGAKVYNQRTDLPSYEGKMLTILMPKSVWHFFPTGTAVHGQTMILMPQSTIPLFWVLMMEPVVWAFYWR